MLQVERRTIAHEIQLTRLFGLRVSGKEGKLLVIQVHPDSPLIGKVEVGDTLTHLNGTSLSADSNLTGPGCELTFLRKGIEQVLNIEINQDENHLFDHSIIHYRKDASKVQIEARLKWLGS